MLHAESLYLFTLFWVLQLVSDARTFYFQPNGASFGSKEEDLHTSNFYVVITNS
jgi:hypothetical protein